MLLSSQFLVCVACATWMFVPSSATRDTKIVYKIVSGNSGYTKIWDDSGSGADADVTYWRPKSLAYNFYALGDVVTAAHELPQTSAIIVQAVENGALAEPSGFTEIWNDRGSGAHSDVRIMRMNAPSGYVCLGNVAVVGYSTTPDKNKYRCVKRAYVSTGGLSQVWNDKGSGANRDVSNWRVERGSDSYVQEANAFLSVASHSRPSDTAYLLNSNFVKDFSMIENLANENVKIKLLAMDDVNVIWKDTGSGASRDFSCWRTKGPDDYYSLGDIPRNDYNSPGRGLVAKAVQTDALKAPQSYTQIWKDSNSGADWDGSFWKPICPGGYVALGHVCSRSHRAPSLSEVRCVKEELTRTGRWAYVWNDRGSGASWDATVYKAVTNGGGQQGVSAMGSVRSHGSMPSSNPAYVLNGANIYVYDGKPVKRYVLTNVQYNLDDRNIKNQQPVSLARTVVENRGTTVQQSTRTLTGGWKETRTWSTSVALELSVTVSATAGVPNVASGTTTVGVKNTFSYTSGGTSEESHTDSISATITVQPGCQKAVVMVGNNYEADIPYTATIKTEYMDGTSNTREKVRGTFKGVNVSDRRVIYEADIPL